MKKLRKILALLLAVLMMAALLAGCADDSGNNDDDNNDKPNSGDKDNNSGDGDEEPHPDFVHVASFAPLEGLPLDYINTSKYLDGKLYLCGEYQVPEVGEDGETYYNYKNGLFILDIDTGEVSELSNFQPTPIPEGREGNSYLERMTVDAEGNVWAVESVYSYYFDLPEDFAGTEDEKWNYYVDDGTQQKIRKLDITGTEVMQLDAREVLGIAEGEYFYLSGLEVDSQGNIYILMDTVLHILDPQGVPLGKIESPEWINTMLRMPDGTIGCAMYQYDDLTSESTYIIKKVDAAAKAWGDTIKAPRDAWNLMPGDGQYDFYWSDSTSFFGFDAETETETKLFSWINCNVNPDDLTVIIPREDGSVIALSSVWDSKYENRTMELVTVQEKPWDQVPHKKVVTYACMYVDYSLRRLIIDFNKNNEQYQIEVHDYSEYNTDEDYTAGITKLTTEILGGDVPDIIATSQLPIDRYAARGMLEDLWPWIEQDTALGGREAVVNAVFDALSTEDGKLWQVVSDFSVFTVAGPTGLVGSEMGWTLQELMAAYSKLPAGADIFYKGMTKDEIMRTYCYMGLSRYVNWTTGECSFNSPEFIEALKFTERFPETYEWTEDTVYESEYKRFKEGKQMLQTIYLSDFQNYQYNKFLLGGNMTFIGYPTPEGNGSAFQLSSTGLAMSSVCKEKEGAWEFIRTILTEEYQRDNVYQFPTNQKLFDEKLKEASTPRYYTDPETGEQVEESNGTWWIEEDIQIEMYALKAEEVQQILDLINATDRIYSYDDSMYTIIMEQCAPFFAGAKTAEETAKLVQSRISLYVNEQR